MDLPKDFSQLFKGLFGFPRFPPSQDWRPASDFNNEPDDDQEDHEDCDPRDQRDFPSRDGFDFHFSIVTDPLEIHRFFEQQMDDMMRSFTQGFGGFGGGRIPGQGGILGLEDHSDNPEHFPNNPHHHHHDDNDNNLDSRSIMLKDDAPKSSFVPKTPTGPRIDTDLDDQAISIGDLSKLFSNKDENNSNQIKPFGQNPWFGMNGRSGDGSQPFFRSFGSSQSQQTIRRSDGSLETTSTCRDSNGKVTTTVRKQIGDEEHIEITKRESDGAEVKIDEFVNMDATGLEDFNSRWDGNKTKQPRYSDDHIERYNPRNEMISPPADKLYGSLFDKFFGR